MDKSLNSYIKIYNTIDSQTCKKAVRELNACESWKEHEFYSYSSNSSGPQSGNQELSVTSETLSVNDYIMDKVWHGLHAYCTELNFSWFTGWHGYTNIRYNLYEKNKKMAEHCDHIHTIFDGQIKGIPTLTILGSLNDNYKGGEFVMFGDQEIKMKQGDIMIFPSNFLYPHRVDPVTSGKRYSFVSWAW
jgi:predicted 2-oxoglutarate/Fe(II)-dependent dioxygenase YbiX